MISGRVVVKRSRQQIVGVKCRDPFMPGKLYLGETGLVRHIEQAKRLTDDQLDSAIKEIKVYSPTVFALQVSNIQ